MPLCGHIESMSSTGPKVPDLVRSVPALAQVGSLVGFIALTAVVAGHRQAPLALDAGLHAWTLQHRTPLLTGAALVVTATGSGLPAFLLAAAAGWFLAGPRIVQRLLGAAAALAALLIGQGVRVLILDGVDRPRPPPARRTCPSHSRAGRWSGRGCRR